MNHIIESFLGCAAFCLFCLGILCVWAWIDLYRERRRKVVETKASATGQFLVDHGISRNARERPTVRGIDGVPRDLVVLLDMFASREVSKKREEWEVEGLKQGTYFVPEDMYVNTGLPEKIRKRFE